MRASLPVPGNCARQTPIVCEDERQRQIPLCEVELRSGLNSPIYAGELSETSGLFTWLLTDQRSGRR
jgi:hypothetical protein